jgi:cytochrome b involved in lipid metabolism
MKKTFAAVTAALVLSLVVAPSSSAAVKAGAACKKAGQSTVAAGMKYTCVKKGSKLVWGKGVAVKAAPAASASAAPSASATELAKPVVTPTPEASVAPAGYTMERVKANNSAASCWSAINGNVYDLTKWIGSHPGGSSAIRALCGTDGSAEFNSQHKGEGKPESRLAGYLLGPLAK